MTIDFEKWCAKNTDIKPLIRAMRSSLPEQYIGFYLQSAFGENAIEYQRKFDWLKNCPFDIYIPTLQLAIEYDGSFYHSDKKSFDSYKTSTAKSEGVYVIRIIEQKAQEPKSRKRNEISYYYDKKYKNIDIAIKELVRRINKRFELDIKCDVDIERDEKEIISYVQNKYYRHSIAYVWPESVLYWDTVENNASSFDVLYTSTSCYKLRCPHCGRNYRVHMKYCNGRKSLPPCDCECGGINLEFEGALRNFIHDGELVKFDDSLHSRRLYDSMSAIACNIWRCRSKEEAEMYKALGFDPRCIDAYLSFQSKEQ